MVDFDRARRNMVDGQLRPNAVADPALLAAFADIPRELFVDPAFRAIAYADDSVPVAEGREMASPLALGRLLQALGLEPHHIALDVGCGRGYSSAILSRLAATAVGLESDPALAREADALLTRLSCDNAIVVEGPLAEGYAAQGAYDIILIAGAVGRVPDAILDQLAEGGRLAAILDEGDGPCRGVLMVRRGGVVSRRVVCEIGAPPMPGFARQAGFVF